MPALHTIEHMAATYLRNSDRKEDIVYFGPMGCRTGCYLVMFGDLDPEDIFDLVTDMWRGLSFHTKETSRERSLSSAGTIRNRT